MTTDENHRKTYENQMETYENHIKTYWNHMKTYENHIGKTYEKQNMFTRFEKILTGFNRF